MPVSSSVAIPGVVESLGGRAVHWVRQPGGAPAVVLLGGCGVPYYAWDKVVAQLGGAEVVRLDRPGLVATAWPGVLPRLTDEVATLAELIAKSGGPAVVVAHSMAGLHAEALARSHPDLVAGLVLVDSSVETSPKRPGSRLVWLGIARLVRVLMGVPVLRPLGSLADRVLVAAQSRQRVFGHTPAIAKQVFRSGDATASVIAEQGAYSQQVFDLAELRTAAPLPPVVVVVLTAGQGGEQWVTDQSRLAQLLKGRQVVVQDSRHLIMIDRPDLVADAVRAVRAG